MYSLMGVVSYGDIICHMYLTTQVHVYCICLMLNECEPSEQHDILILFVLRQSRQYLYIHSEQLYLHRL